MPRASLNAAPPVSWTSQMNSVVSVARQPVNNVSTRDVAPSDSGVKLFVPWYGEWKLGCHCEMKFACPESHQRSHSACGNITTGESSASEVEAGSPSAASLASPDGAAWFDIGGTSLVCACATRGTSRHTTKRSHHSGRHFGSRTGRVLFTIPLRSWFEPRTVAGRPLLFCLRLERPGDLHGKRIHPQMPAFPGQSRSPRAAHFRARHSSSRRSKAMMPDGPGLLLQWPLTLLAPRSGSRGRWHPLGRRQRPVRSSKVAQLSGP